MAEIVRKPRDTGSLKARCLEIAQPTAEGQYIHVIVPSIVAIHDEQVIVGEGAKRLRSRAAELGLEQNKNIFYDCKNEIGIKKMYHRAPHGFRSAAEITVRVLRFIHEVALESGFEPRRSSDSEPPPCEARTVVTVPASFQAAQRNDTLLAAELANITLGGGDLLDEPLAAFIDYLMTKGGVELGHGDDEKKLGAVATSNGKGREHRRAPTVEAAGIRIRAGLESGGTGG